MSLIALALGGVAAAQDLVVWHAYRGGEKAAIEKVVATYNAKPTTKVKVSTLAVPYDAFADKISAAVPRGKGPDIFIYAQDRMGGWIEAGNTVEPIDFYVDDALVHSETITLPAMRVAMSDLLTGAPTLMVDWVRITPYASSGSFVSRVYDAGAPTSWDAMSWTAALPAGTTVQIYVRQGDTATPDSWWTPFTPVASSGTVIGGTSRYVQYRADLSTTVLDKTSHFHAMFLRKSFHMRCWVAAHDVEFN